MAEEETALAERTTRTDIAFGAQGLEIATLSDAIRFGKYICAANLAPKGLESPEGVLIALQLGQEIGLAPMAAIQNIAVINGRPSVYGDSALALVRATGLLEKYKVTEVGEPGSDDFGICVTAKRKGFDEASETFTV